MKRIKLFLAAAIAAIVSVAAGFYSYNATQEKMLAQEQELVLLDANVEALASDAEYTYWFSNLRLVQCVRNSEVRCETVINSMGNTETRTSSYVEYGHRYKCERDFVLSTCNTANETKCS